MCMYHLIYVFNLFVGPAHTEYTSIELRSIQTRDSLLCPLFISKLTESKSLRTISVAIEDNSNVDNFATRTEVCGQVIFIHIVRNISNFTFHLTGQNGIFSHVSRFNLFSHEAGILSCMSVVCRPFNDSTLPNLSLTRTIY